MVRRLLLAVAVAALALAPAGLAAYPLFIFSHMLIFAIACLALNLLYGTAGSLSLGHATFFGAAAYAGAFLYRFTSFDTFEWYFLVGVAISTAFAAAIGFVCVRTTRIHFAILTLALSMVAYSLVINGAVFRLFGGLGWALYMLGEGSMYLPPLPILGMQFAGTAFIPVLYYAIAVAFVASAYALSRIDRSPFGQALKAIRENETRAASIGIPVVQYRWRAFVLSGFFMGVAGALYGELARQITPEQLHWLFSAKLVLATVLGGTRVFYGPVIGAFAFVLLDEVAGQWPVGRNIAFGVLIIVIVFALPRGIAGGLSEWAAWRRGGS
jgi:branched-chain amino acid transport system permease protein